ncbi:uncharacterized protein B0I36DRAFT_369385 [Microdochium trichocladiopsis]|uniref:Uncharacterized protein n=1 Tax=Microdochium trichocladiopsis TaxID=1682393 RepID=A0A9P8XV91_9PEZI|nr:uncharacterized protein B0I36DRAFT_369385 [Microdochium trichocladiopsis]KAH7014427.1 hypothetical protein B0I36DRAFT_369385 [Microdochium trichocladiopsis]
MSLSNNQNDPHQSPSPFLARLPVEIRCQIYDIYMLAYLPEAPRTVTKTGHWGDVDEAVSADDQLIMFESETQDSPPLMRTCRQIAQELGPVASRHLRFVIGSSSTISAASPREATLSLPERCLATQETTAAVKNLQIEWRLNPRVILPESSLPVKKRNMQDCLAHIRALFRESPDGDVEGVDGGKEEGLPSLTALTSVRVHFVVPEVFAEPLVPKASPFAGFRFLGWALEPVLDVLVDELCAFSRSVRSIEFVGTLGRKWLDVTAERLAPKQIQVMRRQLGPNKKRSPQLHEICGQLG